MQLRSWVAWVAGVTVLAWSIVAVVQAQTGAGAAAAGDLLRHRRCRAVEIF